MTDCEKLFNNRILLKGFEQFYQLKSRPSQKFE